MIQDAGTAPGSIEKILRKKGFGEIPIKEALEQLADVPANATVSIGPDLDVSTWTTDAIELDLRRGEPLSAVFLLKIAYEFLAGHLGTAIYDDAQQVSKLRSVICKRIEEHPCYSIERLIAPDYKPFHGIGFEGNDPYAIVQIRFFGKLAYRVHLKNLAVGGDRYVYTHNLKSDEEDIRLVNANDPHYESR